MTVELMTGVSADPLNLVLDVSRQGLIGVSSVAGSVGEPAVSESG